MTGLMFAKDGLTPRKKRAQRNRRKEVLRQNCVDKVWERDNATCRNPNCRIWCVKPRYATFEGQPNVGVVHEEPPRSKGGDPTNPDDCILICTSCSQRRHGQRTPRISGADILEWMR